MTMLEYAARLRPSFTAPAEAAARPAPVRLADGTAVPALVCITPYLVSVAAYQYARFSASFRGHRPVWVLSHPGFGPGEPVPATMDALLARHAQAALACADGAPIVLFGHSAGGWAAHGVAAQLESAGCAPAGVVMADSFRWNPQDDSVIFNVWMSHYSRPAEAPEVTAGELIAAGRYKRLFDEWEPPPVRAPTLLLRSADASLLDPVGGIEMVGMPQHVDTVVQVPGDHFTMMQDHATTTAEAVENWLMSRVRGEP
jgi:pimeloyl-ACP methyl ester carboxylesterase